MCPSNSQCVDLLARSGICGTRVLASAILGWQSPHDACPSRTGRVPCHDSGGKIHGGPRGPAPC